MKTAIYIDNGTVQLVLTPENKFEEGAVQVFRDKPVETKTFYASFDECRGGYYRMYQREEGRAGLILRVDTTKEEEK